MATPDPKKKIPKVMGEFKSGTLHSGSPTGPTVTNPKQAIAIAMSEAQKAASGGGAKTSVPLDERSRGHSRRKA